jgi:hypothetical protein
VPTHTTDKKTTRVVRTAQKVLSAPNRDSDSDGGHDTKPSGDYDQELTVAEVLDAIHLLNPLSNVLQYTRVLTHRGIFYMTRFTQQKQEYYVDTMGMPAALVDQMFDQGEKMARGLVSRAGGTRRLRQEGAVIWYATVKDLGNGQDIENLPAC